MKIKKLAENQKEILKNSKIIESIKITSNKSHVKILHDNCKSNENNNIINRNNDNTIKGIKKHKKCFFFFFFWKKIVEKKNFFFNKNFNKNF